MKARTGRLVSNSIVLVTASAAILWAHSAFRASRGRLDYFTGWMLLAVILFLALYNGRKKLPFLPLGSSETWLQIHIYVGYLAFVIFLVHGNYRWPSGWFEIALAGVFGMVMLSGIGGLILSRRIPRRLATRGGEVFFERIPAYRRALLDRAEQIALTSTKETEATTLLEFYTRNLRDYFSAPGGFLPHLFEDQSGVQTVLARVEDLKRFTNENENKVLEQFAELVRERDRLDYHAALQGVLKGWLFVHIPFTVSLLIFIVAHIVLVFGFSSGAP
jgi:hypothetical protein